MRYSIHLTANVPLRQPFRGKCFVLLDTGAASEVRVQLHVASQQDVEDYGEVGRNFSIFAQDTVFTGATLTAATDCTVEVIVTNYRVETLDGTNLTATLKASQLPLPVQTEQGDAPGNPLYVAGAVLGDTPCASATDNVAVAVTAAGAVLLAADSDRLEVVFYNQGPDPVALGMPGVTWAKRAIVLNAGDAWIEQRAASLAWSAITDAGTTASVTVQERLA